MNNYTTNGDTCEHGHNWGPWEEADCGCLRYIQHSYSHDDPDPNCERCHGSGTYQIRQCQDCGEVEEA